MSGHKGISNKGGLTAEDLAELVDVHRRLLRMAGSLNIHSPAVHPLVAAASTVKAAWAEVAGEAIAWSYPENLVPANGVVRRAKPGETVAAMLEPDERA